MKNSVQKLLLLTIFLGLATKQSEATINLARDFIEFNVVGLPVLHRRQNWPIDPDVGAKRAAAYQQVNGFRGEKLIERLGLGIDGRQAERLAQQRARDDGHLGGLNFYLP